MSLRGFAANTFWFGLLQAFNHLPGLIVLPVVTRAFGPSIFGVLSTLLACGIYSTLIVDFGFNLTATAQTARLGRDGDSLGILLGRVLGAKSVLSLLGAMVFAGAVWFTGTGANYVLPAGAVFAQVIATSFTPIWLFQGIERVRGVAIATGLCRVSAAVLIIRHVQSSEDLLFFTIVNASAAVTLLLASMILLNRLRIRAVVPSLRESLATAKSGFGVFGATVAINLYTASIVVIVGAILGTASAGVYALADRVRQAVMGVMGPISLALYPFVCRIHTAGETARESRQRRLLFYTLLFLALILSVALFVFASLTTSLLGGEQFHGAIPVLKLFALLPVVITISNILGVQTMLPKGMHKEFIVVSVLSAFVGVSAVTILCEEEKLAGAAAGVVFTEAFAATMLAMLLHRRRLLRGVLCAD